MGVDAVSVTGYGASRVPTDAGQLGLSLLAVLSELTLGPLGFGFRVLGSGKG